MKLNDLKVISEDVPLDEYLNERGKMTAFVKKF